MYFLEHRKGTIIKFDHMIIYICVYRKTGLTDIFFICKFTKVGWYCSKKKLEMAEPEPPEPWGLFIDRAGAVL